jgi:hypothetical protein
VGLPSRVAAGVYKYDTYEPLSPSMSSLQGYRKERDGGGMNTLGPLRSKKRA